MGAGNAVRLLVIDCDIVYGQFTWRNDLNLTELHGYPQRVGGLGLSLRRYLGHDGIRMALHIVPRSARQQQAQHTESPQNISQRTFLHPAITIPNVSP